MKEIKNLKGEIVKVDDSDEERWWQLSASTWLLILGLILLNVGCFVKPTLLDSMIQLLDVRLWHWECVVSLFFLAGILFQFWRIRRDWNDYYDYEKKHAWGFIGFGVTVMIILLFFMILSATGRLSLFFRPIGNWFGFGQYTNAALFRSMILIVGLVPLIYFGKEWILGFWDE